MKKKKINKQKNQIAIAASHEQQTATRRAMEGQALARTKRAQGKRDKSTKHSRVRGKRKS